MSTRRLLAVVVLLASARASAGVAAPTFQELMSPRWFPNPQRGMVVEAITERGGAISVRTTGAVFDIRGAQGVIRCAQRIGHRRTVAVLRFPPSLSGATVTRRGPGFAMVVFRHPDMTLRVNGDSLLMIHTRAPLRIAVRSRILPGWVGSDHANHVVADEWGGFGLYCSERRLSDGFDPDGPVLATYPLPADAVLWLGVCPPKPYDWRRSLHDNVVWHWSNALAYPPDDVLRSWRAHGNIVLLQSEVMLWKDWNLDFVPRLGAAEFARVRKTLHDLGMRFMVYTSPAYFLHGTPLETQAMNSFVNFKGWPPATTTGENMGLFLNAVSRMLRKYKPDGLYFDGQYTASPAALYALARSARALVGEGGLLEWHSTLALGDGDCSLPQADAYVDFVLRGEGCQARYGDFDYLRWFVSGYNLSNSIGVLCDNGGGPPTPKLVADVLRANARFHTLASWLADPATMRLIDGTYRRALTLALRAEIDRGCDEREARLAAKVEAARVERRALQTPPVWAEPPRLAVTFDGMPAAQQIVSPLDPDAFRVENGVLHVRGHASTYAYLRFPLTGGADGFEVKLRHGSDGGMSWGPAAALRWPGGGMIRVGTRSDGLLQADVSGAQFVAHPFDPSAWIWLRARWGKHIGVIERSTDGKRYETLWTFARDASVSGAPVELLLGKVPFNAQPADYTDAGPVGECEFAWARVYRNAAGK